MAIITTNLMSTLNLDSIDIEQIEYIFYHNWKFSNYGKIYTL